MATSRFSTLRSLYSSVSFAKGVNQIDVRPSLSFITRNYHLKDPENRPNDVNSCLRRLHLNTVADCRNDGVNNVGKFWYNSRMLSNSHLCVSRFGFSLNCRMYSSATGGNGASPGDGGGGGSEWVDKVKEIWKSTVDAASYTGEKVKEKSSEMTPYVDQVLDTHPYLRDVVVPVGGTLVGTLLAWVVMPRILRRFHKYSSQGPAVLFSGSSIWGPVPYEKSFWGALEDPVRYLITFMAFTQIGVMVAPSTLASQYLAQAWRGAVILSFIWFLHRWKTNVISRALAARSLEGLDRDKLLTLDKVSSVGLFVVGLMALAEACGVAVQSILTVGGIGGVATAFAARDILGNVLSGLSVQFSQPFSIGDTIKAGSVEGQVVEMGLTTTSLLTAEKFPVIVPNSLFSSQVIVNKSRARWRAMVTKIPLHVDDFDKIPQISDDIKTMLRSNSNVFLEREAPYCYLSRVERSFAELTLGCNLKQMSKNEIFSAQQDILLQSVRIINQHGARLSSTLEDATYQ